MRLRDQLPGSLCWEAEGGGGGSPAPAPASSPALPPGPTPTPAPASTTPQMSQADKLAELRAESANYRIKAREAEERSAVLQQELAAATARAERERAEALRPLQEKLSRTQQRVIHATLTSKLVAAGLTDPDLASLISSMPDAPVMTLDDSDTPVGIDEAVQKFVKWKPALFRAPADSEQRPAPKPRSTGAGGEPPPSGEPAPTDVKKMTKEQYAAFKARTMRSFVGAGFNGTRQ